MQIKYCYFYLFSGKIIINLICILIIVATATQVHAFDNHCAYREVIAHDANHIVYVRDVSLDDGSSWADATSDLQRAINAAGVEKVFVVTGNYNAPANGFVMKSNVEIYGGFDPDNEVADLSHSSIFTNPSAGDYTLIKSSLAIGAYEYEPAPLAPDSNGILYVNKTVIGGNASGNTWANAIVELADALEEAKTNTTIKEIWVAKGTYLPKYAPALTDDHGNQLTDRDKTFLLVKDVKLYGGFDPDNNLTDLNTRSPELAATVLSGDVGLPGTITDNAYHVVLAVGNTGSAELNGFTVSDGHAKETGVEATYQLVVNTKNVSRLLGGGIYMLESSPMLTQVNIAHNSAVVRGGGIYATYSSAKLNRVHIYENTAEIEGGGMLNANSSPVLTNVLIYNNTASVRAGGLFNGVSSPVLTNVIIGNNTAGGMLNNSGSSPLVRNSIIYGNSSFNNYNSSATADKPVFSFSIIQGSGGSTTWQSAIGTDEGHNLDVDPQFIDAANGDYRLKVGSPAMNAGDNTLFNPGKTPDISTITTDMAGNQRIMDGLIDLGVYEMTDGLVPDTNGIIYVKTVAAGNGTGDSWENATANLQAAINAATSQVWVAKGTYTASQTSFKMKNGIAIYGGFDLENNIDDLDDARIIPNTGISAFSGGSVLSGDNKLPVIDNLFTESNPLLNTAILDGFTLTNGSAVNGGGIANTYASPTLSNLLITGNEASASGGGLYNRYSSPVLTNIVVNGNTATNEGGGIYSAYGALILNTTLVKGNEAGNGGGIYVFDSNNGQLADVVISGNSVTGTNTGSAIHAYSGTIRLLNTTIAGNTGNAFYNGATTYIDNSILYGGADGLGYTAKYSIIEGVGTADLDIGSSAIAQNLIFSNPSAGDFSLLSSAKAVNAGNNALYAGLTAQTKDIEGHLRLYGTQIDLGAYELQAAPTQLITPDANSILYVNKSVNGGNGSGDSWINAIPQLADALQWADNHKANWTADNPLKIYVAKGTYLPKYRAVAIDDNSVETTDRDNAFLLVKDVKVYGGFDPETGLTDLATRYPQSAATVLSGDIGVAGVNTDNAYHVVISAGDAGTAELNGFTISGANATGDGMLSINAKNVSRNQGAGIYSIDGSPIIAQVRVSGNTAKLRGGGMYNDNSSTALTNVVIDKNTADNQGAGMYNANSSPVLTNVTIVNNTLASNGGGGLYNTSNSSPKIHNSIIFGNTTPNISNNSANDNPDIVNSLVQGINSDIDINSIFTSANGDYTLKAGSPAIDKGSNILYTNLTVHTKDLAGNPRVYNYANSGIIDLGAYESTYTAIRPDRNKIVYVKTTATGTGAGDSWTNATADLQGAIDADSVQQVRVAAGIYDVPATHSFVMKNSVAIYGGFDPNGLNLELDDRLLPGSGNDQGSILKGDGQKSVIYNNFTATSSLSNTAILDGFTITGGMGVGYGGGIFNWYASPVLRNLVIKENTASYDGGAVYNFSSSPVLTNIIMVENKAQIGAAMSNNEGSNPVLTNVAIRNNDASIFGGAFYNYASSPELTNTVITGNTAPSGSAFYNEVTASPVLTNVTISNNTAGDEVLIANSFGSSPQIRNSIIHGNMGSIILNSNYSPGEDIPVISYSLVQGSGGSGAWVSSIGSDGGNNIDKDPLFANSSEGKYGLSDGSPALNRGSNVLFADLNDAKDLAGNPRLVGTTIDLGAYENQKLSQNITAGNINKTYGDTPFGHGISDSDLTLSYTSSDTTVADIDADGNIKIVGAGIATITARQEGNNEYLPAADVDFVLTVAQAGLIITADPDQSKVYGAADSALTYTVTGLIPGDVLTGTLQRAEGENAGNYDIIQGTLSAGNNYTVDFRPSTFSIAPKMLTITADAKSKVYGAADPELTYTKTGLVDRDVLAGTLQRTEGEDVGNYDITQGTLSAGDNYTLDFKSSTFSIAPKMLTITADAKSKVYGAADPELTYTKTGLVDGDVLTGKLQRAEGEDVGNYDIVQGTLSAGDNYTLDFKSSTFSIAPKALTVTADAKSKIYGAADPELTYTKTGLVDGDVLTGKLQRAEGEDVGNYDITQGTLSAGDNYTVDFKSSTFSIAPKTLTITADAKSKTYGATDPELTYTKTGLIDGNVLTGTLQRAEGEDVGNYDITQGTLSAGDNYTVDFRPSTLTISGRPVMVIAEAKSKTYGASDPALTYTVTGLIPGDALTGTLQRAAGEDVGNYDITRGTLMTGKNYQINFQPAEFAITKAVLNITVLDKQMCQGAELPVFEFAYSGFENGDGENSLGSKPVVDNPVNSTSPAGSYVLRPSGAASGNYTFVYIDGQLTVNALPQLTISSDKGNTISKGETVVLTASGGTSYFWANANGVISGQNTASLTIRPSGTGTYTVTATNAGGCSQVQTFTLTVLDDMATIKATNILSPNNDGYNDKWIVDNIDLYPDNEVKIFDKAGRLVYTKKGYNNTWDGTFNGTALAENTYYYIIDFGKDRKAMKGYITILR